MSHHDEEQLDALIASLLTEPRGVPGKDELADELELAAASAMLATLPKSAPAPLPAHLRERLLQDGQARIGVEQQYYASSPASNKVTPITRHTPKPASEQKSAGSAGWFGGIGWAAAAVLGIALITQQPQGGESPVTPQSSAELQIGYAGDREGLLSDINTITLPWTDSEYREFAGVSGDVVWNNERQEGYLRLVNMPTNIPTAAQYQLWIVDPERAQQPVDGGVFDVLAVNVNADGEVLIPIDAKLDILDPAAFAITREQPGGVVVSAGPLLLVAAAS
ncbi:MAG: anti-sigma factor [Pseudomonadota bacterium]